jgi:anti-anti-sigma factor
MRARRHGAPLVVIRNEAESGQFGLRLIGELDLSTVDMLAVQLARTPKQSGPSVIDVSELRFLDLIGLRALQRAGQADGSPDTRLVGATGIVQRIIELVRALDPENLHAREPTYAREPTRRIAAKHRQTRVSSSRPLVAAGLVANSTLSTRPAPVPAARKEVKLS